MDPPSANIVLRKISSDFFAVRSPAYPLLVRTDAGTVAGATPDHKVEIIMVTPIAYSIAEACAVARTGRTALYEAIRAGELAARKRGRRTLILAEDLHRWVENLPVLSSRTASECDGRHRG